MSVEKVLSIRPPWSTLIIEGYKLIENRGWRSNYIGKLLIHSSRKFDSEGAEWIFFNFPHLKTVIESDHHKGFIIGSVDMVACVTESKSKWFVGPYGFVFKNPFKFEKPIQCKGALGIFNFDMIGKVNEKNGD